MYATPLPPATPQSLSYFDLSVPGSALGPDRGSYVRNPSAKVFDNVPKPPRDLNATLDPSFPRGVLHCKGEPEGVRTARAATDLTSGMYPHTGYARHQKPGLAVDFNKPMNGKIMPVFGNYDVLKKNPLGQGK